MTIHKPFLRRPGIPTGEPREETYNNGDWEPVHLESILEAEIRDAIPQGVSQLLFAEGDQLSRESFLDIFMAKITTSEL